jgi:hypothetical protein
LEKQKPEEMFTDVTYSTHPHPTLHNLINIYVSATSQNIRHASAYISHVHKPTVVNKAD